MIFRKRRQASADYAPQPEEYAALEQEPPELRSLYRYAKTVFLLLFSAGCGLSLCAFLSMPLLFFIITAGSLVTVSVLPGIRFKARFPASINTRLKAFVFLAIPPACMAAGVLFGLVLVVRIMRV